LPVYLFVAGFVFIKASRFLVGAPKSPWGPLARLSGIMLIFITLLVGLYIFYWLIKTIKFRRKRGSPRIFA
jgi:hypothetical protein